jgi:hypothetical protein
VALLAGCGGGDATRAEGDSTSAGSGPPREQGGEKSIEGFGEEASAGQRAAILTAFDASLNALAKEDFAAACANFAAGVRASLTQLAGADGKGIACKEILPRFLSPTAAAMARGQVNGRVTKVRVRGGRAFVLFHAPGAKLYMTGLVDEGGEWKTTTVIPSVLVPEL